MITKATEIKIRRSFFLSFSTIVLFIVFSCSHKREIIQDDFAVEHEDVKIEATEADVDYSALVGKLGFKPDSDSDLVLLNEISGWLGTPYRYGGKSKNGADCSGFVLMVYRNVYDIELTRRSFEMAKNSRKIRRADNLREGDLVFFRIKDRQISHVGIYLGNGRFVHASSSRGVVINKINEPYYSERFAFGGRVR